MQPVTTPADAELGRLRPARRSDQRAAHLFPHEHAAGATHQL